MEDIDFYDKQVEFEEKLGKIQKERSRLEKDFSNLVRSDKNLQSLRAAKLRSYWKHISEREKKARLRNEGLLRDFSGMEARIGSLQMETDKLRKMKREYEQEIARLYPQWKQEVELTRARKQLKDRGFTFNERGEPTTSSHPAANNTTPDVSNPALISTVLGKSTQQPSSVLPRTVNTVTSQESPSVASISKHSDSSTTKENLLSPRSSDHDAPLETKPPPLGLTRNPYKSPNSHETSPKVTVPPLELPDLEEETVSETTTDVSEIVKSMIKPLTHQIVTNEPKAVDTTQPFNLKSDSSLSSDIPLPVTPTHYQGYADDIQRVEINSSDKRAPVPHMQKQIEDGVNSDELSVEDISEVSSVKQDNLQSSVLSFTSPKSSSPKRYNNSSHALKLESSPLPSPTRQIITVPHASHDNVESVLSESLTTETSHKTDLPLTSSAAYQELMRGHDLINSLRREEDFSEEEDELEQVLSPKVTMERDPESDSDIDSQLKVTSPQSISTSEAKTSEPDVLSRSRYMSDFRSQAKVKAPWDTDSDEEDSFDSRAVARDNKLNEDDYDFFDS